MRLLVLTLLFIVSAFAYSQSEVESCSWVGGTCNSNDYTENSGATLQGAGCTIFFDCGLQEVETGFCSTRLEQCTNQGNECFTTGGSGQDDVDIWACGAESNPPDNCTNGDVGTFSQCAGGTPDCDSSVNCVNDGTGPAPNGNCEDGSSPGTSGANTGVCGGDTRDPDGPNGGNGPNGDGAAYCWNGSAVDPISGCPSPPECTNPDPVIGCDFPTACPLGNIDCADTGPNTNPNTDPNTSPMPDTSPGGDADNDGIPNETDDDDDNDGIPDSEDSSPFGAGGGPGGGDTGSASQSGCGSPPACSGDAIACALLDQQYDINCADPTEFNDIVDSLGEVSDVAGFDGSNTVDVDSLVDVSNIDDSGFLSSACPLDQSFTVSLGSGDFTYEHICEWASIFNPIIIALSYFLGSFMVVRALLGFNS